MQQYFSRRIAFFTCHPVNHTYVLRPLLPQLTRNVLGRTMLMLTVSSYRFNGTHLFEISLDFSYPMVCLIIASKQVEITGHPTFSFEMLFEKFRDQLRASTSAPVQLN